MAGPAGENILKVLSGNQYGVEVALPDGTYSFGSGAEADIQLLDLSLQPLHGLVRLRDGKVEVRTTGGELSTASGLLLAKDGEDWHEIAQMDAVSAGMSKFVIGGPGANWTSLAAPAAPRPVASSGIGDVFSVAKALPRRVVLAVGGGVAVLLLVALLAGGGSDATQRWPDDAQSAVAALRQTVQAMPFASGVTVVERADGTLAIEGYVEEQVERRAIQNALDESGLAGTLQVFVRKNLRADIEGTIQSMQVPASFELDPQGHLTLSGTVLDPAKAEKLVSNIETGVFGLASVTSELRTAEQILEELREIAGRAGLDGLVIFRLDGLVLEATGIVPRDKMDNWAGLIGVYSRRFAQDLPLRSFVTLDQPAATDTAPVIFGSGPVAEAQPGRVVAPETLAEPSEVDARSLFAGQPAATPTATLPDPLTQRLTAAMSDLRDLRPDLYRSIEADLKAGQVPAVEQLQEVMRLLGGSLRNTGRLVNGEPEIVVETARYGSLGTLPELRERLPMVFGVVAAQEAPPPEPVQALPLTAPGLVERDPVAAPPLLAAGETAATPTDTAADPLDARLAAALAALRDLRPDLYGSLEADQKAGRIPSEEQLQEAVRVLGGSLRDTGRLVDGQPEMVLETEGYGTLGTVQEVRERLPAALAIIASGEGAAPDPVEAVAAGVGAGVEPTAQGVPTAAVDAEASALPTAAVDAEAPVMAETQAIPAQAAPVVAEPVAVESAAVGSVAAGSGAVEPGAVESAVPVALTGPSAAASPGTPVVPADATGPAAPMAEAPEPAAPGAGGVAANEAAVAEGTTSTEAAGGAAVPIYALPKGEALSLGRIMDAAEEVVGKDETATAAQVSPDLRELVWMQTEQLQMGKTLIRLPQPLSALPTTSEKAVPCWEGSSVQPAALPMTLLVLDVMSVSADMDVSRADPQLRDALMEVALSPQRVRACLAKTGSPYGSMVAASSAFLAEIDRNPSFAEFLFRNVPRASIPLAGVNLAGERYVELRDGRKLGEGSAPDIASRIMTIGDTGILIRTAEGTQVQLFGDRVGWRVVDACDPTVCGVN